MTQEPSTEENAVAAKVLDGAFLVHKELGPGLLESVYELCLSDWLVGQQILIERQKSFPVSFQGKIYETGFRADMIVANKVIVELKAVESILPVHEAQMLTYLKLTGIKLGLLINFNVPLLKQGIRRFINKE